MSGTHESDATGRLWLARTCVVLAAILWSSGGWFAKHAAFDGWPVEQRGLQLAFWRALFAGLLIVPLVRRPRWRWKLVPLLLAFWTMNATYLSAMVLTTAANAIWLQNTGPMWVFLIGLFTLREPVRHSDMVLLAFGMLGVGLILFFEAQGQQLLGVSLGVLSGVAYGSVVLGMRALRSENSAWLVSLSLLSTAVVLAPFVLPGSALPGTGQLTLLACFGLLQMGLPYVLFAYGVKQVPSQEASGIALLEPILLPLWVLHTEVPNWWTAAGGSLILVGLTLTFLRPAGRPSPQPVSARGRQ